MVVDAYYQHNDKSVWGEIYAPFCDYIRTREVSFDSNAQSKISITKKFYETIEHLSNIMTAVSAYYRKRKKAMPEILDDAISEIRSSIDQLTDEFETSLGQNLKTYKLGSNSEQTG